MPVCLKEGGVASVLINYNEESMISELVIPSKEGVVSVPVYSSKGKVASVLVIHNGVVLNVYSCI